MKKKKAKSKKSRKLTTKDLRKLRGGAVGEGDSYDSSGDELAAGPKYDPGKRDGGKEVFTGD